jgi:hypothetical protein
MKKLICTAALGMILLPAGFASACPMCKDSIPNSDAEQANMLPQGFNYSIYCMLSGFFLTLGFAGTAIVKGVRSSNARMKPPTD